MTGAASGLGAALVAAFEAAGDRVLATDVSAAESSEPSDGSAGRRTVRLDITSDADWERVRDDVLADWGGLDLLVNNAGIAGGGRLDVATIDEWQRLTEVNLFGMVRGLRTWVPVFKRQGSGHIVNVASLAGLVHPAGMASYNAVKAGVVALTETAGHELAGHGVRCSVVCPSYFRTALMDRVEGSDTALVDVVRDLVGRSPFTAEQIAAAVLAGIDTGDEVIIPDPAAQSAVDLKRADRATYDDVMRAQAAKLDRIGTTEGSGS